MRTVPISAEHPYQVEVGVDWTVALTDWVEGRKRVVVICSENFRVETDFPTIVIPDGEVGKELTSLENIWQQLAEHQISRDDLIIAIGGGAVTDVAGFAASTWLRGVDWLAIPTTFAAMVDAAIGGKTGINSTEGKNLIGAFHSPISVLIDLVWLKTLPKRDLAAGMAEVIKCGFIFDSQILKSLNGVTIDKLLGNQQLLLELIFRAVSVKAEVVGADFKESFQREILNYGHTLGHAIEKQSAYQLRHGEAVAIGLCFAAELSHLENNLPREIVEMHYEILKAMNLPTKYDRRVWNELFQIMRLDKKNRSGKLRFVGLSEIGICNRIEDPSEANLIASYEKISQ